MRFSCAQLLQEDFLLLVARFELGKLFARGGSELRARLYGLGVLFLFRSFEGILWMVRLNFFSSKIRFEPQECMMG